MDNKYHNKQTNKKNVNIKRLYFLVYKNIYWVNRKYLSFFLETTMYIHLDLAKIFNVVVVVVDEMMKKERENEYKYWYHTHTHTKTRRKTINQPTINKSIETEERG